MTQTAERESRVDGRVARRERNIDAVLDVVLDMFGENMLFPTIEQASKRSGLSLRSLYRYFADPGELVEAAIKHDRKRSTDLTRLSRIGQGRFDRRLDEFVAMRVRLYEAHGSIYRASVHNAGAHSRVRDELERNPGLLREQFALQFAPELNVMADSVRASAVEAGNVLTQLDSIDLLRGSRHLTAAETTAVICDTLRVLLAPRV